VRFTIERADGYLRAEIWDRRTAEETETFLRTLAEAARKHTSARVLICVHSSLPIFRVERYGASAYLKELSSKAWFRVAVVADQADILAAHQYLEILAAQQGANVRSFADEELAERWLLSTGGRRRVLLVEDNADQSRSMALLLGLMGHEVSCATTGYAALDSARGTQPSLVILDLGLPGLDGFEVARRLREEHGTGLRIIALTAYASEDARARARDAGCDAHLVKPLDPRFLESLLA
jgi:CheY-like chemotaxis protein